MHALLFYHKLVLNSGAGQLLRMQALGLRAEGARVALACEQGAWRFFLRTGLWTRRASASALRARTRRPNELLVDHSMMIPEADIVFVHNLAAEAGRHLERDESQRAATEHVYFRSLRSPVLVVANSMLVKRALTEHFALRPERIVVHHPGYQSARFGAERRAKLRTAARKALGIGEATPLIGFVTSGDFHKRGLDLFLAAAERIAAAAPEARFLIVGSRRLPDSAAAHPLFALGKAFYRPKNHHPEHWIAALDVFLYAARFEEFGMVVLEALALGVPVLTSRRVGAAECLPPEYASWLADEPRVEELAARALALMADAATRARLVAAGIARARAGDDRQYGAATARTILKSAG